MQEKLKWHKLERNACAHAIKCESINWYSKSEVIPTQHKQYCNTNSSIGAAFLRLCFVSYPAIVYTFFKFYAKWKNIFLRRFYCTICWHWHSATALSVIKQALPERNCLISSSVVSNGTPTSWTWCSDLEPTSSPRRWVEAFRRAGTWSGASPVKTKATMNTWHYSDDCVLVYKFASLRTSTTAPCTNSPCTKRCLIYSRSLLCARVTSSSESTQTEQRPSPNIRPLMLTPGNNAQNSHLAPCWQKDCVWPSIAVWLRLPSVVILPLVLVKQANTLLIKCMFYACSVRVHFQTMTKIMSLQKHVVMAELSKTYISKLPGLSNYMFVHTSEISLQLSSLYRCIE